MNKNFMGCMKKKKYKSEKFAYGIAIRRMLDGCKKQLYIYRCDVCFQYHITRQERNTHTKVIVSKDIETIKKDIEEFNRLRRLMINYGFASKKEIIKIPMCGH